MTLVTIPATVLTPPTAGPSVTAFHQSAARWLEGSSLARASANRRRPPIGTTFTFRLNETATYVLAFSRTVTGRTVKGHCVAQTRGNRRKRACPRAVPAGSLRFGGHAGINKIAFQGRLARASRLSPGYHTVTIVATDAWGNAPSPSDCRSRSLQGKPSAAAAISGLTARLTNRAGANGSRPVTEPRSRCTRPKSRPPLFADRSQDTAVSRRD